MPISNAHMRESKTVMEPSYSNTDLRFALGIIASEFELNFVCSTCFFFSKYRYIHQGKTKVFSKCY